MKLTRDQIEVLREGVTPGPLIVQHRGTRGDVKRGLDFYRVVRQEDDGDIEAVSLAHCVNAHFVPAEANANLFAAAPDLADTALAALDRVAELEDERGQLREEIKRAWQQRNEAVAKVKAWESQVYIDDLPLLAAPVDEFGSGHGETVAVPCVTPKRITELLDELRRAHAALEPKS